MNYLDFVIHLGTAPGGGYSVRVSSPKGRAEAAFTPPDLAREIHRVAVRLEQARDLAPAWTQADEEPLSAAGDRLFRSLFPQPVRDRYYESLGSLPDSRDWGLRLRIQTNLRDPSVARLHSLPWEYLYREDAGLFLSLGSRTSIVRHLDLPLANERPPLPPPLRILLVVAQPRELPALSAVARELQAIEALKGPHVEVPPPVSTLEELRALLRSQDFHVLHFLGHGGFDSKAGNGLLYFEDEEGSASPVQGSVLANRLRDHTPLRLVFLNACRTAEIAAAAPFAGVASALLQAGIPAVVAMQFPITDQAAADFSATFYKGLIDGDPVDEAVAEGRLAIEGRSRNSIEWATPALFLQSQDGRIFQAPAPEPQIVPEPDISKEAVPHKGWRKPWAAIGGIVLLSASLLYLPGQQWTPRVNESSTHQSEANPLTEVRPAPPSTPLPEQGRTQGPEKEKTQPSVPPPSKPELESRNSLGGEVLKAPSTPRVYELTGGQPVSIKEFGRHLTADFFRVYKRPYIRLHLEGVEENKPVIGPGKFDFQTERGTCSVYVLAIDQASRTMRVRPLSGTC